MSDPIISVVMPVFNSQGFLEEAVRSILGQSYTDFELLVIDDSSTDDSYRIAEKISKIDSRVRVLRNKYKKGIVGALNFGLANSKGKYIARMDSDDISRRDRFEKQVNLLDRNPSIALVGTAYAPFNENGIRTIIKHPETSIEIAWKYLFDSFFCHPSVMFRSCVIGEVGSYPEQVAEDYAFFSEIVQKRRCWNLQEPLLNYREHSTNLSISKKMELIASVELVSKKSFLSVFGNLDDYNLLRKFVVNGEVSARESIKVFFAALIFSRKLRRKYKGEISHQENFRFLRSISFQILSGLMNSLKGTR